LGTIFYESNDPTNSVKALKEDRVLLTDRRDRIQYYCTMHIYSVTPSR